MGKAAGGVILTKLELSKGKALDLKKLVEYAADSIVSKTLVDTNAGTITLFAFDAKQGLSEHTAPYDAVVQIIDGEAEITIGGNAICTGEGEMVIMPANVRHALRAVKRFKMLLTMIRA
jgi:quercetin dioxygenase-like cupin family protein